MAETVDGIYAAYFTGMTASSFGLFLFRDGVIAGADAGGAIYNGGYRTSAGFVEGEIVFSVPSGTMLITGLVAGGGPIEMKVPFKLNVPIVEDQVLRFETPAGPVNGKLKLLRSL
ncbi:MAG TPA: hypothetical protein VHA70_10095 [Bauldia sp.]|nr:hypothetical protein [Bauldia sp.]